MLEVCSAGFSNYLRVMSGLIFCIISCLACAACGEQEIYNAVNESLILTASYSNSNSYLLKFPAFSEMSSLTLEVTTLKEESGSILIALFADTKGKRMFFVDYMNRAPISSSYLGIYSFKTQSVTKHLGGMMQSVESIAYDWVTGNLYWADLRRRAVVVTEKTFQYFIIVVDNVIWSTNPCIAVHAQKRLLFHLAKMQVLADPQESISAIRVSDMAGENIASIYWTPFDIENFYIDYNDDRIYWGENTDSTYWEPAKTTIMSCNLDGKSIKQHGIIKNAQTRNIAAHRNTIYVSQLNQLSDPSHDPKYYNVLHYLSKDGNMSNTVTIDYEIEDITIYNLDEEFSISDDEQPCLNMPQCDHICLPTNTTRVCVCSEGFVKEGDTGCRSENIDDNYVLVADVAEKRFFQFSILNKTSDFFALPIELSPGITDLAMNKNIKWFYWSDRSSSSIYRAYWDGSNVTKVMEGRNVTSLEVDPYTGNVYFVDDDTESIHVMDKRGCYVKALMKSGPEEKDSSNIQSLALDNINKLVYWLDYNGTEGTGQLKRMSYDGSNQQLVKDSLLKPTVITVDDQRSSLFINNALNENEVGEIILNATNITDLSLLQFKNIYREYKEYSSSGIYQLCRVGNSEVYLTAAEAGFKTLNLTKADTNEIASSYLVFAFYQPKYFTVFRSSHWDFLKTSASPCANRMKACSELCLDISPTIGKCVCGDGRNSNPECEHSPETDLENDGALGAEPSLGLYLGFSLFFGFHFFL